MDVRIDCLCPGQPHPEGDTVVLRETLDFHAVTAIRHGISILSLDAEESVAYTADILALLTEGYVTYGIESWTITDADGQPVAPSRKAIREILMTSVVAAQAVGDAADELYGEKVTLPLLVRASSS